MVQKDCKYWRDQINSAKGELKSYFTKAKKCNEAFSAEKDYNIFYSNVLTLEANLMPNMPKPDIQRRFLKKVESDKLKYNTYLETAKVSEGCLSYYSDISGLLNKCKKTVNNSARVGRGITWVEYTPTIGTDAEGQEYVAERKQDIISLNYDEYLQASSKTKDNVWWKARRHLMSGKNIESRFGIQLNEDAPELNFEIEEDKGTAQKVAEVWEVWDKSSKKRYFFTMNGENRFLEDAKDPYKLTCFFPCEDLTPLTSGEDLIPIPEYTIYRKLAEQLDTLTARSKRLSTEVIKYVLAMDNSKGDQLRAFANASDGDGIGVPKVDPASGGNVLGSINAVPVDPAIQIVNHITAKKVELQNDIYAITGISDIARGQGDARETATAQKIKGVFGSLRFQDRQKQVQEHIKKIYQIQTELICEHWDAKTMSEVTCTYLPTQEEKEMVKSKVAYNQVYQNSPERALLTPPQPVTKEEQEMLERPTWDDILGIMRDDKLRSFTIDVETDSTVFDDKAAEQVSIQNLTQSYLALVNNAGNLSQVSPELVKGFLPIMKLNLKNIKAGRALAGQLEEAVEGAYNELVEQKEQPQQPDPTIVMEQQKLQLEQQKAQADVQERQMKAQAEMAKVQNESRKIAIEEQKLQSDINYKQQELASDNMKNTADIENDRAEIQIKQQDANRKERELQAETAIAVAEIETGIEAPTIAGDIGSVG